MGFWELLLVGVGLSADAFAVAICKGLAMEKLDRGRALLIGAFFGGFQALMPLIGWLLGARFEKYIANYDHWIAFALLAVIGGKMIYDALKKPESCPAGGADFSLKELTLLAVATSIDALAVGVSFAFLSVNIWEAISVIGVTTFVLSVLGVAVGHRFGGKHRSAAEIAGGTILILIGLKTLLTHLGVL